MCRELFSRREGVIDTSLIDDSAVWINEYEGCVGQEDIVKEMPLVSVGEPAVL